MSDITNLILSNEVALVILLLGVVTYLTRIGGYLVLSRFENIPSPVQAGLEAVPVAVITTLVVPPAFNNGLAEAIALIVTALACFRFSPIVVILMGQSTLVALRLLGL